LGICGGQTVRDATFTNDDSTDGFTIVATNLLTTWGDASTFGDTDDDKALIELHAGIRWSSKGEVFTVDMDVVPDTPYRLQMLFQEKCCQRGWDVRVEDILIAENISPVDIVGSQDMSAAAQLTLDYVSTDDKLSVVFGGVSEAHGDVSVHLYNFHVVLLFWKIPNLTCACYIYRTTPSSMRLRSKRTPTAATAATLQAAASRT
jgi:hypothetical protein